MGGMVAARLSLVAVLVALACVVAAPAHAAFPGANGKIAYDGENSDIFVMNPDGTGVVDVTNEGDYDDAEPDWSPDGTQIAFSARYVSAIDPHIDRINLDGTGRFTVGNDFNYNYRPQWSPDGQRIGYTNCIRTTFDFGDCRIVGRNPDGTGFGQIVGQESRGPVWSPDGKKIAYIYHPFSVTAGHVFVANADGTGATQITFTTGLEPTDWSPDGTRILLYGNLDGDREIYSIKPDGTGLTQLTNNTDEDVYGSWSPDGSKIVFNSDRDGNLDGMYVMNADGTGASRIRTVLGRDPDWQPIPINAYPRPKGATPFLTYLVPAYAECTSPNRTHGPSLAVGSCNPPTQVSDELTVGSADSNGKPTKSVSSVRFDTVVGNPSTPADEADVAITAQVIDVYTQAGLADYAGSVTAKTTLRITDKLNTPHPGGPGAATVSDIPYEFTIPCAVTADTTIGGACLLSTSADALAPGAVKEGKRSIWQLGAVEIYEGGANPDLFMKQGIFVP